MLVEEYVPVAGWKQSPDKFVGDPKDYKDSEYLKNLKETFLKGEYPLLCPLRKADDARGMESKRIRENKTWEQKGGDWNKINDI